MKQVNKMKSLLLLMIAFGFSVGVYAQTGNVGINTNDPKATLDVKGSPADANKLDGIILPRLTGEQLRAKTYTAAQTGAQVYVTLADPNPAGQTIDVTAEGNYYFNGTKWVAVGGASTNANREITKKVYIDTDNPNTATQFSTGSYYNNYDCSAAVPTASFTANADPALAQQDDVLYIAQSACDADGDYAEYSYWVWNGSNYIAYSTSNNTAWYLGGTKVDARGNKNSSIFRKGLISVYNDRGKAGKFYVNGFSSGKNIRTLEATAINDFSTSGLYRSDAAYIQNYAYIPAGINNSGILRGAYIASMRRFDNNEGELYLITGCQVDYGHYGGSGASPTKNAYGLIVNPYTQFGSIETAYDIYVNDHLGAASANITNKYGLYVLGAAKTNYFEGKLGIGTDTPTERLEVSGKLLLHSSFSNNTQGGLVYKSEGSLFIGPQTGSSTDGAIICLYGSTHPAKPNSISLNVKGGADSELFVKADPNGGGNNVGIDTEAPAAKLDVRGYVKLGSSDVSGDATPQPGMIRYNSTTKKFQGYTEDAGSGQPGWVDLH